MIGEVQYGGRVTDDFDHFLMTTFAKEYFTERIFMPDFNFYPGYIIPKQKNLADFLDYINTLPSNDSPEVLGLHPNADITYVLAVNIYQQRQHNSQIIFLAKFGKTYYASSNK
jgi:dynein heavy chain